MERIISELPDVEYEWAPITSRSESHQATFHVFADALKIGGVRESFTAREAQAIADELGALLPTPKLLDLRYDQHRIYAPPAMVFYHEGYDMFSPGVVRDHSVRIDRRVEGGEGIVGNVGKHWVLHEKLSATRAVLYGWHVEDARDGEWYGLPVHPSASGPWQSVIQPPSDAHDHEYHDYSTTLMLVHGECEVDGQRMATADVLRSPDLCHLAVASGRPLALVRVPGVGSTAPRSERVPSRASRRPTLRNGSRGDAVVDLQSRLVTLGYDLCPYGADGEVRGVTERAVREFQAFTKIGVDGIVGKITWGALLAAEPEEHNARAAHRPPPKPSFAPLVTNAEREAVFGRFQYRRVPGGGGRIELLDGWAAENTTVVEVPQLACVPGISYQLRHVGQGPQTGRIRCHRLIADQLRALWQAWEDAGLLDRVLTWDGLWAPRFVTGSSTTLSNHAFATAFDVNAPWNPLGATPAPAGTRGSVEELVPLANEHGFYWGGHFERRRDGMHFEVGIYQNP